MACILTLAYLCLLSTGPADAPSLPSKPAVEQSQKQNAEAGELTTESSRDSKVKLQKDEKSEALKDGKAPRVTPTCKSVSWGSSERWVNGKLVDSSKFKSPVSTDCNAVSASSDYPFYGQPRRNGKGSTQQLRFNVEEL